MKTSSMIDISTAHLSTSTQEWLFHQTDHTWLDKASFRVIKHEYGLLVYVMEYEAEDTNLIPPDFRTILDYALSNECMIINFDEDAEVYKDIPIYQ